MSSLSACNWQDEQTIIDSLFSNYSNLEEYSLRKAVCTGGAYPLTASGTTQDDLYEHIIAALSGQVIKRIRSLTEKNYDSVYEISLTWWNSTPKTVSQEGKLIMFNKASEEINYFIEKLMKLDETKKILTFTDNRISGIWVVVDEADIDLELKYSDILFSVFDKYPLFECDFMVFGKDEIDFAPVPKDTVVAYSKEEV
jgi:hypothetical protein